MIDPRLILVLGLGVALIAAIAMPVSWWHAAWYWLLDRLFRGWAERYLEQAVTARVLSLDPNNGYVFMFPDMEDAEDEMFLKHMKSVLGTDARVVALFSDSITVLELDHGKRPAIRK